MPKWVNCKHCKGNGWLYPSHREICRSCENDSDKKQVCGRCRRTGWENIVESVMCCSCNGDGRIWVDNSK